MAQTINIWLIVKRNVTTAKMNIPEDLIKK